MVLLAWIILPLLVLIAVPHELGHLVMARRLGVTVREFGLGLPPRLGSVSWQGIRWSVGWLLPLGAFVKLKGEDSGTEPDDFAALGPGRRSLVVLAGPVANLLVAGLALLASGVLIGEPTGLRAVVQSSSNESSSGGLVPGDVLVSIDGAPVRRLDALAEAAGRSVHVTAVRGDTPVEATVSGGVEVRAKMGYRPIRTPDSLLRGFRALTAASEGVSLGPRRFDQVAVLGWVGLAQVMQELGDVDIPPLAWFLALLASLSLGLGVMNLLPIPPLDGGRLALYAIEAARQRPAVAPRLMTRLNLVGLVVLVAVFAAVTGTDVLRWLSGQSILAIH